MKQCPRCKIEKPDSEFADRAGRKTKKQLWCKSCANMYYSEWRLQNKEKSKPIEEKSFRKFYSTPHGRAVHMLNNIRSRAKKANLKMSITIEWLENKLQGVCEVTGIPFILQENGGRGHRVNSLSPSVDRIDQTGDYTPENCQMTCWIYNRAKGAFPVDDLHRMIAAIGGKARKDDSGFSVSLPQL